MTRGFSDSKVSFDSADHSSGVGSSKGPTLATVSSPVQSVPSTTSSIPTRPPRRVFSARNFVALLVSGMLVYAGAVWYSFKSDNFHDFFTEYIPGSERVISAIQDYE